MLDYDSTIVYLLLNGRTRRGLFGSMNRHITLSEHRRSAVLLGPFGSINFDGWLWIAVSLRGVYYRWDYFPWG